MKTPEQRSSSSSSERSSVIDKSEMQSNGIGLTAKCRTFRIPSHNENVLQALNRQRLNGEFCDVTILVEHQRFMAHKCVLASCSLYFKELLSNENNGAFLRHISADSFRAILDFMYTSRLQVRGTAVQDVLAAAKFLQVRGVVSICCRFLESQIRTLARDLDEHTNCTRSNPTVIPVNSDAFKNLRSSRFQPQEQLSYNQVSSNFCPDEMMMTNGEKVRQSQMSIAAFPNQQLAPVPNQTLVVQSTRDMGNQNGLPAPARPSIAVPMPVPNNAIGLTADRHFAPAYPPVNSVHPAQGLPLSTNPRHQSHLLPWESNVYPRTFPFINGSDQTINQNKISSYDPPRQLPLPPVTNDRTNPTGNQLYTSLSTGGRDRRPHLQPRRRVVHGPVSAPPPMKFCFSAPRFRDPKLSFSTPRSQIAIRDKDIADCSTPVVTLTLARENRLAEQEKPPSPSDTVFDIEAEDRYWGALSRLSHPLKYHQNK